MAPNPKKQTRPELQKRVENLEAVVEQLANDLAAFAVDLAETRRALVPAPGERNV